MPSTTRYRRGDIVLVPFPFTDLSSTKKRPALVVSPDKFNEHAQDVVLVAITSQPSDSHVLSLDEQVCSRPKCAEHVYSEGLCYRHWKYRRV